MKNKSLAKDNLGYKGKTLFIWVGRLDSNKDPLTILGCFSNYVKQNENAKLLMIYGSCELEGEVKTYIHQHKIENYVDLIGSIEHDFLEEYYNASDYFILGSHHEGSGYALCEAMACGCVPIVTNIPSFYKMTNKGQCAYLFYAGDSKDLNRVFKTIDLIEKEKMSELVLQQFKEELSFEAIANKISKLIFELTQK